MRCPGPAEPVIQRFCFQAVDRPVEGRQRFI